MAEILLMDNEPYEDETYDDADAYDGEEDYDDDEYEREWCD